MSKKKPTKVELTKALSRLTDRSVFDDIIKEIEPSEIPAEFIDYISIHYKDGTVVDLYGEDLRHPIPVNKNAKWKEMEESFKNINEVKIYVNTEHLEIIIDEYLDDILGKHFS